MSPKVPGAGGGPSAFAVRRPVLTTMATLIVALLGAVALTRLQIDLLPEIELPTLSVRTEYEGASPEVMERTVTQIFEEILATVPGVVELSSQSARGSSQVRVTFGWGVDIDVAAQDVRAKLEDELSELPEDITRPQLRKFDIGSFPVVLLGVSSRMDPVELTTLVEDRLRPRFSRLPSIAQVDLWGGFEREIRVELSLERLEALGLPLERITEAIRAANLDLPAGQVESGRFELGIRAPADLDDVDAVRRVSVPVEGGSVRLADIADIEDTHHRLTRIIRVDGEPGIRLAIRKEADANTAEVARRVLEEVAAINADYPQLEVVPVLDQGDFIERSIANVARSVGYGGGLAVLVLLVFLASLRSSLVVAVAIPVSLLGTFAVVYLAGLTVNLTTLGGLGLAVGMMVDSSIVVLENVFRRARELGEPVRVAAIRGAAEVGPAILASTLTTSVVFLPLGFVRGVAGLLFRELAYVVVFGLVCSLAVALTVVPVLAATLLEGDRREPPEWLRPLIDRTRRGGGEAEARYRRLLDRALDRPWTVAAGTGAALLISLACVPFLGSELLPPSDEGQVRVRGELELGTRLGLTLEQTLRMEGIVLPAVPESIASVTTAGASSRRPEDGAQGEIQLTLPPVSERNRSSAAIAADLRQRLDGQVPGMRIRIRAPQGNFLLERLLRTEDGLTVEVYGFELETLDRLAHRVAAIVGEVDGVTDVEVSRRDGTPQATLQFDRDKLAALGLTARDAAQALQTAAAGRKASELREGGNAIPIFVQLADVHTRPLEDILRLPIALPSGRAVSLRDLVRVERAAGPVVIERKDQQRFISVAANVAGRPLGSVAADVDDALGEMHVPDGYEVRLSGAFEEQVEAFRELLGALGLALALVFMVLASQYESLTRPLVVMLSVPLGGAGVLITLLITGTTLNLQSYMGCITLGGIVVNNAILLVDQAGALTDQGTAPREAALEAGRRRLRPILMTTLTTVLGLLPLALGLGEGADAQAPLARAVIGGLVGSTPVTLLLVPVVFAHLPSPRRQAD